MLKLLKAGILIFVGAVTILCFSLPVQAGLINVPGDFPGQFRMDLLAVNLFVDVPSSSSGLGNATLNPNEAGIDFSATAFDGTGNPTWGTSTLATLVQNFEIGNGVYFSDDLAFFIEGGGPGTLTDLGNGTGDWELTIPLYAVFGGNQYPLTDLTLSTSSTVSYYDQSNVLQSVSGIAMDYTTGDALLVGQVTATSGPFTGLRGTFVIDGNDPAAVPEPSSILLIATGLAGLVRIRRKIK